MIYIVSYKWMMKAGKVNKVELDLSHQCINTKLGSSGKRISDLSGPLAAGKFSIFYMSTYQTDFVLVNGIN